MAIYIAAVLIVAGVALFVASPFTGTLLAARRRTREELEAERLEHERGLAMQGLRELEFDREMGKLSEADFAPLKTALEERALAAMTALEKLRAAAPRLTTVRRRKAAAPAAAPGAGREYNFCPECGARVLKEARFCVECGSALAGQPPAARQAE